MLVEAITDVTVGVIKFIFRMFFEIFVETLIKGAGTIICRFFNLDVDPESGLAAAIGLLFWLLIIFVGMIFYKCFV